MDDWVLPSSTLRHDKSVLIKSDMNITDLSASDHDVCFDGGMHKAYGAIVILSVNSQLDSKRYTLDGNGWSSMLVIIMFFQGEQLNVYLSE